jgi:hypothetical protein
MAACRTKPWSMMRSWRCAVAALLLAIASISGCKSFSSLSDTIKGDGFSDEFAHWGEKQRAPTAPGQLWSLSEQGQEVERNLGVR